MEHWEIQLKFNADIFREMYYKNGKGNVFVNSTTRRSILIALYVFLITAFIYFLSLFIGKVSWLLVICAIVLAPAIIYMIVTVVKYKKWKKDIEIYLKELSGYKLYKLIATDSSVEVLLDSTSAIEKWDNIKSVYIENDHVQLYNPSGLVFIIPKKSMTPDEFEKFAEFVRLKVR